MTFSLPSMPAGCKINTATLSLYATSASTSTRTLQALQVAATWTETGVTWTNQPSTTGSAVTTSSGTGWRDWVVTSMVQSMYSGTNYGFLIRDAVEGSSGTQVFNSRESGSNKPQLVITYTQGP